MSVITKLTFGRLNLSNALYSLASLRVVPPFARDSAANAGRVDLKATQYAAGTIHPEIGGGFTTKTVEHEEGTVILLQASRTRNRVRVADGGLFLRIRKSAPRLMIRSTLPTGPEGVLGSNLIAFAGNADVLTREELRALGYEIPRGWVSGYMQEDEINELFTVDELVRGTAPRPTFMRVATSSGVSVLAVQAERPRRLRIRR